MNPASALGQQRHNLGVYSIELVLVDGNSDQHIGDALGRRACVAKSGGVAVPVAVKVAFISQLAMPGNQHASNLLELPGTNGCIERAQPGVGESALGRGSRRPAAGGCLG